ncbi:2-(1,2-epoxy-1,2-dihydrophenyl)acetyl-CoA isomerase [Caldalkalibacillus uzonensis]|uniref:2-(1,2-epoxy-1,2-dihydrophenyl)acetyl-CoA isomerase n=1 Tax=Caldalkalibacillus uzonensis TaxID=353224 RepID=A0ABU0CX77_9BACI|nr:enoyl-CoA hydratase-related protein [Caldalkalibacillus uzonensis]MDQ0340833.1 2-(1,2-epoxy-1,2-dihydrophenyl)acetyl-CoA isomerase [Caldalkalibacillus uzonensis]
MSALIHVHIEDHIQTITLNRPEKKNAFNSQMIGEWVQALEDAQNNKDVHVVVVTGAGDVFCAGGDVGDMQEGKPTRLDAKNMLWEDIHRIPFTLQRMDKPVIAAINGPAVGAGLDMALMADIRTMADTAKVSEGYVKVGLVPGDGGAYFLPRLVGEARAYELLWTGRFVDAEEALQMGLVNHVFPRETFMEQTMDLARQIASGPQIAIRMIKRSVRQSMKTDLETALDLISSHMAIVTETEDHKEGVNAFLEKRKPKFTGR